ncbi:MAG: hypothetical protein QOF55_2558 [Thermoleophilaceae bacterium]|jgi:hypothetical protein|nr:hypothetical protein [Thermoleophilaceae bacterium]
MIAAARTAQDLGIAVLLGGNLFGRRAMHPALEWVSSPQERGKVVTEAWRRYGAFNSLGLAGVIGGWALERSGPVGAKDVAVAAVAVTGVASAIEGVRFGRSAPGGAVPLQSGSEPSSDTPVEAARNKRLLNALGQASALAEVALVSVNAVTRR